MSPKPSLLQPTLIALAQALTCPEKPNLGCGTCSSCQRVLRRNHPDVTWVLTEDDQVKRGIMGQVNFWQWIEVTRADPTHKRNVTITLQDEQRNPVIRWKLVNARPMKWTGPTLAAKGGSDVAMEELVIASEGFEFAEV